VGGGANTENRCMMHIQVLYNPKDTVRENIKHENSKYRIRNYPEEKRSDRGCGEALENDVALRMRWREALQMIRTSECMWPVR
jgi:hypothetical protein